MPGANTLRNRHCTLLTESHPKQPPIPRNPSHIPPAPYVVGYNTLNVAGGSTTAMSVQFKSVGSENDAGVMLKDVIKLDKPTGKTKGNNGADEIWVYADGSWAKYYFWASRGSGNVWLDYNQSPKTAADAIAAETKATLKPGQCFFFVRGGSDAGVASLSGEVVPLTDIVSFNVAGGSTTAMAFPWPTPMPINDFTKYIDKPVGKTKGNNGADEIWVYADGSWAKYYFWASRGAGNVWLEYSQSPKTAADAIAATTTATLLPGQAFFFVRGGSDAGVISFDKSK